jgi:hypothetical protein
MKHVYMDTALHYIRTIHILYKIYKLMDRNRSFGMLRMYVPHLMRRASDIAFKPRDPDLLLVKVRPIAL